MINETEWSDWKLNNVTKAFFAAANERVEDAKEILASSAGQDSVQDSFFRGFITAYREMADFRLGDVNDD